jgi:Metallo-peptidase family M12
MHALILLATGISQVPAARLEWPLEPLELVATGGVEYAPAPQRIEALHGLERATLTGCLVPTPAGLVQLELDLLRLPEPMLAPLVALDGAAARASERRFSAFVGRVAGEQDSNLFLALSESGLRGWIERAGGRIELDTRPGPDGSWNDWRVLALDGHSAASLRVGAPWGCATPAPPALPAPAASPSATSPGGGALFATGPLVCKLALETDHQFFQHFNDLGAAEDYARSLTSAVSSRLWAQSQIVLQLSYLGLYSTSSDPWSVPDTGGDMLGEFTTAWQNQIPGGAHLGHFISGGLYFGGVAYVDVLCNPWWGFGVSTGITGSTPFPVNPSWLTWDFFVLAHELGHQFGSWHTHDYCPALDSCAGGPCVAQVACSDQGTIMSYCHGCGAGMANITTWFHPTTAQIIRQEAEASCLPPYTCSGCACPWPALSFVTPFFVAPYSPSPQIVTVSGCHFDELEEVRVDGVALPASAWQPATDTSLSFAMPLVSKTGTVDLELISDWGTQLAQIWVVPSAQPVLNFTFANPDLHLWLSSLDTQYTFAGMPGDLAYLVGSFSGLPTEIPGVVSLGIGNQLGSLYVVNAQALGASAWTTKVLPLEPTLAGSTLYFQGAVLRNAVLPLLTSQVVSGYVLF